MSATPTAQDNVGHLALEGELTIYHAAEVRQQVLAALRASPVLELDLAGVTELDTAGLQVLMLAKQTAQAEQRELRLVQHSQPVVEVFQLLDLGAFFGDALLIHA
ncbi:lipid asymmetry maintenance protein MlaB [Pseudoduganella danionis]|uniref:STAS domain-containing protein n=1 Tax=Pseudoduganella danionis TaxID=1890295 RepID=A0ABW9ST56_9BURK|nr:STAS domain-containing protein [Pseudoduganella danionis]MTW35343.1 STAS domain-containing protein [Pseudoduganella danionis]